MLKNVLKVKNLFVLAVFVMSIIMFSACNNHNNTQFCIFYRSKTYLTAEKFCVGIIRYDEQIDAKYKLKDEFVDDFHNIMVTSKFYSFKDKVRDYRTGNHLFDDKEAYIFTNSDSYFAVGSDNEEYYHIHELVGYVVYSDLKSGKAYQKEFTVPPYLNNVRYSIQNADNDDLQIIMDEKVTIPYEWEYLENFYSKLDYSVIDKQQKKIIINCYSVTTDMQLNHGTESIDRVGLIFSSENNINRIQFVVE